jgi:hypothetical protein
MNDSKFINNIFNEINSKLNIIIGLYIVGGISFLFNIIIILDINKLKKENNRIKMLNEKVKQQNDKMMLKLSLFNDTVFNNHKLLSDEIYFQRSNMFEIIDKIDYLISNKNSIDKPKKNFGPCNEKNIKKIDLVDAQNDNIKNDNIKNDNIKNDTNKKENSINTIKDSDDLNNELLDECYDNIPCNNINKITNNSKYFFKIF